MLEGFLEGILVMIIVLFFPIFEGSSSLSKDPSKLLQNAFKNPSKTFQEGVEIDDALGFPGLKNQLQGPGFL